MGKNQKYRKCPALNSHTHTNPLPMPASLSTQSTDSWLYSPTWDWDALSRLLVFKPQKKFQMTGSYTFSLERNYDR